MSSRPSASVSRTPAVDTTGCICAGAGIGAYGCHTCSRSTASSRWSSSVSTHAPQGLRSGRGGQALLAGPAEQFPGGRLLAHGALVEAQVEQELVGLAHARAGLDAEDRLDLVAV